MWVRLWWGLEEGRGERVGVEDEDKESKAIFIICDDFEGEEEDDESWSVVV